MSATAQYEISGLLEQAGANPRGNRHDCPKCGGYRTVTHTAECFYCHKCQWKGNGVSLAKELGLHERLPRAEYVRQRKVRERAKSEARNFLAACRAARLRACDDLRELARLELLAHEAGPDHPSTWDALEMVYRQRPVLTAEAVLFSEGAIADRRKYLEADAEERQRTVSEILLNGGTRDDAGKFIEAGT